MQIECSKCKVSHDHKHYGTKIVQNKLYFRKVCKNCRKKENRKYYIENK
jgi:Fe2+ or Zn2+ uptake regulation protein